MSSWFSVFRSDGSGSGRRRSAMNAELRRLSRLAQFEHDVTTGSLRGFVARKVYEHRKQFEGDGSRRQSRNHVSDARSPQHLENSKISQ